MTAAYVYKVLQVNRIVDGDTYWMTLDVGFRQQVLVNIRLNGYDCPELFSGSPFEREAGKRARDEAALWLARHAGLAQYTLWVLTAKDPDNFGRWLGSVWAEEGDRQDHLGVHLRGLQLASVWPTRWTTEFEVTK